MSLRGVTTPVGVFPVRAVFAWGAVTGTTAGELLRVQYSGIAITGAELALADGRVLELDVTAPWELSLLLPPDTPDGPATLTATLADGSIVELVIFLTGAVVVPPRIPGPPVPPARRRRHVRTVVSPSRVVLHSGTRLRIRHSAGSLVLLRAGLRLHRSRPADHQLVSAGRLELSSRTRVGAVHGTPVTVTLRTGARMRQRDIDQALLLLDLI